MSSLRGARMFGEATFSARRSPPCRRPTSVVWVRKARLAVSGTSRSATSSTGLDQAHRAIRNLAESADDLRVAGVADKQDVPALLDKPLGLAVDLGHERAGGVHIGQAAVLRFGRHRLRNAMRRENHRPVVGNLVQLVDKDGAEALEPLDDKAVVDDLVPYIDRRPEPLERELDDLDRSVDPGAEAARGRDQHAKGRMVQPVRMQAM